MNGFNIRHVCSRLNNYCLKIIRINNTIEAINVKLTEKECNLNACCHWLPLTTNNKQGLVQDYSQRLIEGNIYMQKSEAGGGGGGGVNEIIYSSISRKNTCFAI